MYVRVPSIMSEYRSNVTVWSCGARTEDGRLAVGVAATATLDQDTSSNRLSARRDGTWKLGRTPSARADDFETANVLPPASKAAGLPVGLCRAPRRIDRHLPRTRSGP